MKPLSASLLILLSALSTASAQVAQQWVARHDGPDSYNDVPYAMTLDALGNIYVTGTVSANIGSDCVTIKYNPAGVQQWLATFNGGTHDVAFAITTDPSGNVYVAGSTQGFGSDYMTLKYDAAGQLQWARIYEGPVFEEDSAYSIAVDGSGNVYVTGYSTGEGTSLDYATIKYSPAGDELWVRRLDSGVGEDVAASLALVPSGIVVTGRSSYDYTTVKYDFDGVEQWVRAYNGPGNSSDSPARVTVDRDGNIYVTGMSLGAGTNFDYATIKYSESGVQQWVQRYDGPSTVIERDYDYGASLAVDDEGNVFVTGNSADDFATVKYDAAGVQLWVQRYGPPGTGDNAAAIAVDASGNAYVTGTSYGDGATLYDFATISYDPSGATRWIERYNGPGNFYDSPYSVAVDASGNVYVSGQSGGSGTGLDFATIQYSQSTTAAFPYGEGATRNVFGLRNEPNPFNPTTTIRFTIAPAGARSAIPVRLGIYDAQGREMGVLVNEELEAGTYERELDGSALSSGTYYYRLESGSDSETGKMIRLR